MSTTSKRHVNERLAKLGLPVRLTKEDGQCHLVHDSGIIHVPCVTAANALTLDEWVRMARQFILRV